MAYLVKVLDGKSPHHVKAYLNDAVEHSRFMLTAEPVVRDDDTIDMNKVRLREDYGRGQMVPTRWWNWGTDDQFLP